MTVTHTNYAFIAGYSTRIREEKTWRKFPFKVDLFVHQNDCVAPLEKGQRLRFQVQRRGERGWGAINASLTTRVEDPMKKGFQYGVMVVLGAVGLLYWFFGPYSGNLLNEKGAAPFAASAALFLTGALLYFRERNLD